MCTSPTCTTIFSLLQRRHHCRRCGNIFCNPHSSHAVPLDQEARFHPDGALERSCDLCWADFQLWHNARTSRSNSGTSLDTATATSAIRIPSTQDSVAMGINGEQGKKDEEISKSFARVLAMRNEDWNWSTF